MEIDGIDMETLNRINNSFHKNTTTAEMGEEVERPKAKKEAGFSVHTGC